MKMYVSLVPDGCSKLCVESVESERELRQVVKVGTRHDLQRGAAGKVILSFMTPAERIKVGCGEEQDCTLYDKIRESGVAISDGEREDGLFGIAVPILDRDGNLVAAISISGPTARSAMTHWKRRSRRFLRWEEEFPTIGKIVPEV